MRPGSPLSETIEPDGGSTADRVDDRAKAGGVIDILVRVLPNIAGDVATGDVGTAWLYSPEYA